MFVKHEPPAKYSEQDCAVLRRNEMKRHRSDRYIPDILDQIRMHILSVRMLSTVAFDITHKILTT